MKMSLVCLLISFAVFHFWTSVSCADPTNITYAIVAPKSFRPGSTYNVTATCYNAQDSVILTLSLIASDNSILVQATVTLENDESMMVPILVRPDVSSTVTYSLSAIGSGGLEFNVSRAVDVQTKTLSLFIQTDKAIYKPGQTVLFRVIAVYPDLKPYQELMDISITDSANNEIYQLLKQQNQTGVVGGQLVLASQVILGGYTIAVNAEGNSVTKTFQVAEYVLPKFQVTVNLPSRYLVNLNRRDTQQDLFVTVKAEYTYGQPVQGRANVIIQLNPYGWYDEANYTQIIRNIPLTDGGANTRLTIRELISLIPPQHYYYGSYTPDLWSEIAYRTILVVADVTETVTGVVLSGNSTVACNSERYTLAFLGISPSSFKPGLAYWGYLQLAQSDGTAPILNDITISKGIFKQVSVKATLNYPYSSSGYSYQNSDMVTINLTISETGYMRFSLQIGLNVASVNLQATYYDDVTNNTVTAWKSLVKFNSRDVQGIQISYDSPTGVIQASQNVTFTVKTTQPISQFQYDILSKGIIVLSQLVTQSSPSSVNNITIYVSKELAVNLSPTARVVVWFITSAGEIIADSTDITVQDGFANQVALSFDTAEARPGAYVNLTVKASSGSYVGVLAVDQSVLLLAGGNDITQDIVTQDRNGYGGTSSSSSQIGWGPMPLFIWWWPIIIDGTDSSAILDNSGVFVMTDGFIYKTPPPRIYFYGMMDRGVGVPAPAGAEGVAGPPAANSGPTQTTQGSDQPRIYFPETWLWTNTVIGPDGKKTLAVELPDTITSWIASAFAINDQDGLGVAPNTAKVTGFKPFFLSPSLPYSIVRGEEFGLQVSIFNYLNETLKVKVTLGKSKSYTVLVTNAVSPKPFYANVAEAKTVQVASQNAAAVDFWIKAVSLGPISISLSAQSSSAGDVVVVQLLVIPEGIQRSYSTSTFVSLTAAEPETFRTTFNITLPPAGQLVPGSQYIDVTVIGDLMGPAISGLDHLLQLPTGCGEQTMIGFAPDVYILKYLTSTGRITSTVESNALADIQSGYQRELTYQRTDSSFSAFGNDDQAGSTWLTAFVVKCFHQAKDFVPVSDAKIASAMTWIIGNQAKNGSFSEPPLGRIIHVDMQGGSSHGLPLTAYVLISFLENRDNSVIDSATLNRSIASAQHFLEIEIDAAASDPYSLCIMSYSLARANSPSLDYVLNALQAVAKTDAAGTKHWEAPPSVMSDPQPSGQWFNPPYVQSNAINIEMTSYALLTYCYLKNVSAAAPIVKWIVSQRSSSGGFSSTQDTVMALEALSEFATMTSGSSNGPPNMNVAISTKAVNHSFEKITEDSAILLQSFQLTGDLSSVDVSASGHGSALVQLNVEYNVYNNQTNNALSLNIETQQNGSQISIDVCSSWNGAQESGMVVMEITQLTGYQATNLDDLKNQIVDLKRVDTSNNQIILYLDELTSDSTCFVLICNKVSPVSNIQPAPITVYSYYDQSSRVTVFYKAINSGNKPCVECPNCCSRQ